MIVELFNNQAEMNLRSTADVKALDMAQSEENVDLMSSYVVMVHDSLKHNKTF